MKIKNHVITLFDQVEGKFLSYFRTKKMKSTAIGVMLFFSLVFQVMCDSASHGTLEIRHCSVPSPGLASIEQSERDLPVVGQADVVIAGGGVAGVAAALRAAEEGLSVILIESRNYFGQELTSTYQCRTITGQPHASTPLAQAMHMELAQEDVVSDNHFKPGALRSFLHNKIAAQPKIEVYLYSLASGVVCENKQVRGVVFSGLNGRQIVLGKVVVDATEDARIATAAGANLIRTMFDAKTARRFISASFPGSLSPGPHPIASSLGLSGNRVTVHNGFIELEVEVSIGDDAAGDLSAIQAITLEKSFNLRDHLVQEGVMIGNFTPSPETWIDEIPAIACRGKFSEEEIATLDFSSVSCVLPVGIEGLVIAGRTVDTSLQIGNLQALLGIGELAGRTAVTVSRETDGFPPNALKNSRELEYTEKIQVRELLDGIEPGHEYQWIRQSPVELPVRGKYDVLVIGGGTSGAISAIAAARQGANVAIIEILPNLGGIGSNRVNGYYWGVPWKSLLRQELGDRIHLAKSPNKGGLEKVGFRGEDKKHALQDLALRAGVQIYYQSLAAGAVVEGNRVQGVVVENASGRHILLADVVIDATGQAGIAAAAGANFAKGRDTDGFIMEMERGPLRDPTHIGDISEYYLRFPSYAVSLNIRESRRIIGDYMVTFDDVIHEKIFSDIICRWRSNYDTHFPSSANQSDLAQDWTAILGLWRRPILGSIPYRSLLPKGMDNILVAGKAYSTDHDALIGGRMQPDLEHLGEAAGVAAAMASSLQVLPRDIPVQQLQVQLVKLGVLRDKDVPGQSITGGPSLDELHRQDLWRKEREKLFPPEGLSGLPSLEKAAHKLGTDKAMEAMVQFYLAGDNSIPWLRAILESETHRIDEEVIPRLQPKPGSKNQRVYEEAAVLLGLLGDRSAVPALLKSLKERNTRQFRYTLPNASSRPSVPLYWSSVILLGRFQEKEAVPMMLELLANSPPPEEFGTLRRSAYGNDMFTSTDICPPALTSFIIVALGRIGDPKAKDAVRPFLKVSNSVGIKEENKDFEITWGVQTNAAWALAQMGDYSGVPALIELLEAEQAQVRDYAQRLLETITGEQLGRDRQKWEEWWQLADLATVIQP